MALTNSFRSLAVGLAAACVMATPSLSAEPATRMKVDGPRVLGAADAPLTLVEFSDYECSYCQQYNVRAFGEIKRDFIDTGKVRYVVRDFPLSMHRNAFALARAARCADELGRFWEMRDALFAISERIDLDAMAEAGAKAGLDAPALRACIQSTRFDAAIRKDMAEAEALGVNSTPSFVLGRSQGEWVEGTRFEGSQPYAAYETRIKALMPAQ